MSAQLPVFDQKEYPNDLELKLLQVVHRHGERTPVRKRLTQLFPAVWTLCDANKAMFATIAQFSKDQVAGLDRVPVKRLVETETDKKPSVSLEPGSCYYGQLTNLGRYRMTLLGQNIRDVYINRLKFLPDTFDEKSVYLRSTDYIRTQESIQQMVTVGLYPKEKRPQDFEFKLNIRDPMVDNMFPNPNCYRLRHLSKQFTRTVSNMFQERFIRLSDKLKNHVDGVSLDSHPSANGIMDTLIAAKVHGFKLPKEFDDETMLELEDTVVKEWFYGHTQSQEMRRLGLGRLMGAIRDRMMRRAENTDNVIDEDKLKLAVYSGHDTTVAPLLIILGAFDDRWPPFGSAILFELFKQKESEQHYVRVKYNENALKLPGCAKQGNHKEGDKSLCTLEAFKSVVKDQVPQDWEKECKV